jgi:hypothetical protein
MIDIKYLLSIFLFCFTTILAFSQEKCDNGIDDDVDGYIDCFDSDCSSTKACEGFY